VEYTLFLQEYGRMGNNTRRAAVIRNPVTLFSNTVTVTPTFNL